MKPLLKQKARPWQPRIATRLNQLIKSHRNNPPDERRDRAKVNEAVRDGIRLGPLRPAGSADLSGVPKATE